MVTAIYVDVDDVLAQSGRMFLDLLARDFGKRVRWEHVRRLRCDGG